MKNFNHGLQITFEQLQEYLKAYQQEDRERTEWLWGYYCNILNKSTAALMEEAGLNYDELKQIFTGCQDLKDTQTRKLMAAVEALRKRSMQQMPLVRTTVTERILDCLDRCRDEHTMTYISGPTGRGKSYAAEYWAKQNNHGRSHFIRCPSNCNRSQLIDIIANSFGLARSMDRAHKEQVLFKCVTSRNVLILDEAGHLLSKTGSKSPVEFLRDIHDMCHCGIALILTDVYIRDMKKGKDADYFEQFIGRMQCGYPVDIPQTVRKDEVRAICRSFIDGSTENIVEYALVLARERDGKLRTLFNDFFTARDFAASRNEKLTLSHLKQAAALRKSFGAWPEDN